MLLSELTKDQHLARVHAARIGRVQLLTFCHLNNPDPQCIWDVSKSRYQWKPHHKFIANHVEKVIRGEILFLEIETPPRIGKTQVTVRDLVPFLFGNYPDKSWIVVTATDALAQEHGRDVRDYMDGAGYKLVFGHNPKAQLKPDVRSTTLLQVMGGGKCIFTGKGGLPAGVGGDGIIFDDFFKSAEEAASESERNSAWRSFVADCQSRRNNDKAWVLMIGSRKHEDDVQGRLFDPMNVHYDESEARKWTRIRLPALAEKDDPLGRAIDEPLWPEKFGYEHYNSKRNHASPVFRIDFQTQDQCKPVPEEGNYFKKDWLKTWKPKGDNDLPRDSAGNLIVTRLRFYGASDHALRKKQQNDSTCLLVAAVDPADRIFILPDTVWEKLATDIMVERMLDLMRDSHTDMWWAARDQISGSIEPFLRKRQRERGIYRPWDDSISELTDLVQRGRSIQARMAMGMVYWPSHWEKWGEAEAQLLAFPNGKHDDLCLTSNTLVLTYFGYKPICKVTTSDKVLTRQGWKRVLWSGMTGYKQAISKAGITGTENHPVWTENRGWVPLASLKASDELVCVGNPSRSMAGHTTDTRTVKQGHSGAISTLMTRASMLQEHCTETFTSILMALSRGISISTTRTAQTITAHLNWNFAHLLSTAGRGGLRAHRLAQKSCDYERQGRESARDMRTSGQRGSDSEEQKNCAGYWNAHLEKHSEPFAQSVRTVEKTIHTTRLDALKTTAHQNAESERGISSDTSLCPVYNLQIEDCPEFFANGVLVHNCAAIAMLGMGLDRMTKPPGAKASDLPPKGSFAWHSFGQNKQTSSNTAGWV